MNFSSLSATFNVLTDLNPKTIDFTSALVSPTATTSPDCGYTMTRSWAFTTDITDGNTKGYDSSFMSNSGGVLTINTTD